MTVKEEKYSPYKVLTNTAASYSPDNWGQIVVFIEIKGRQNEWFTLGYLNNTLKMLRGPRHGISGTEQRGPEFKKEKNNLGTVEIKRAGMIIRTFQDYGSFWEDINKCLLLKAGPRGSKPPGS